MGRGRECRICGEGSKFREDYDTGVRILLTVYIICQYCLFDCLHCNRLKLHSSLNIINSNNNFGFVHSCVNLFFVRTAAKNYRAVELQQLMINRVREKMNHQLL